MTRGEAAVLVMARAPIPGRVKTRLQPRLGPVGCARLQAALIHHTVLLAQQVAPTSTYLALDPWDSTAELTGLIPSSVSIIAQHGTDLGARMCAAVGAVMGRPRRPVVVIGTDAPTLTETHLRAAADHVVSGDNVVFGPAVDGGYYLVALDRPRPEVFAIDPRLWGGPNVLSASLMAARTAGLRVGLLERLRDLDRPADAEAFLRDGDLPAGIADLLAVEAVR